MNIKLKSIGKSNFGESPIKYLINKFTIPKSVQVINMSGNVKNYINSLEDLKEENFNYNNFEFYIRHSYNNVVNRHVKPRDRNIAYYGLNGFAFNNYIELKKNIQLIEELEIEDLIRATYTECSKIIPNRKLKVILFPSCTYTCGFAASSNFLLMYVNCNGTREEIYNKVRWTFAHEYAHTCDIKDAELNNRDIPTLVNTVLKDMIFEGKANRFANLLYGNLGYEIKPEDCSREWKFYYDRLNESNYKLTAFQECKIGNESFSRYDVYYYGTKLVESYHNTKLDKSVGEILKMMPSEFYDQREEIF